jgi:hypothetical protein
MIRREITPIANITRRAPEAGRIRMGDKGGTNGSQRGLNAFRFTSPDRPILEQIAQVYGGNVTAWSDPKASPSKQWQLYSEATEINVMLIPGGFDTQYEAWSGGGIKRRCDGVVCSIAQAAGDDYEMVEIPCPCREQELMQCDAHSRLTVVLPEFSFLGTWRLESKGWNAAQELPGMHDMILEMDRRGRLVDAVLSMEKREKMVNGKKKNFVVPRLAVRSSVVEMISGPTTLSIGTGPHSPQSGHPELTAGRHGYAPQTDADGIDGPPYDDIAEAELVTDEQLGIEAALRADAENFGLDPDSYLDAVRAGVNGDWTRMANCSVKVRAGDLEPINIADGRVQWRTP